VNAVVSQARPGIRIGVLAEGGVVFGAARAVIDSMEKQSRNWSWSNAILTIA
jgi:hypothetical protein